MATTKEHIIQYCKDHNFKLREEDFDGSIHQYSKYLSKTILLFIGVSDTMFHDVVAAVFDEMTGLGFNPKK